MALDWYEIFLIVLSIAAVILGGIVAYICYVKKRSNNDDGMQRRNSEEYLTGNDDKQTYEEEKRIIRVPKNKLSSTLPLIFEQELKKLSILKNSEIDELKTNLENDIKKEKENQFIENYLLREYKIDIKTINYIGAVMIKFKRDNKNDSYLYIACLVRIQKYSLNDNIKDIQNNFDSSMKNKINLALKKDTNDSYV